MPIIGDYKHGFDPLKASDLLRRSLKMTKLQERELFKESVLLHSSLLTLPIEPKESSKTMTFKSDPRKRKSAFAKILELMKL